MVSWSDGDDVETLTTYAEVAASISLAMDDV